MDEYLVQTELCDWENEGISKLSDELKAKSKDDGEYAVNAFYWVRDNIFYFLGPLSKASETLKMSRGNCFTKSNLLVALLRADNIPARFQFQSIRGEALADLVMGLSENVEKTRERFNISHCMANVKLDGRWLRADCTRDKYLSPQRANEWDAKEDTKKHPYLIKDLEYVPDLKRFEKYTEAKKFKNLMEAMNLIFNEFIDEKRYKNSGIRCLSKADSAQMKKEIHDLAAKGMGLKHKGDARVMAWLMKRLFSKPLGLNIKIINKTPKEVEYLCNCCVANDTFSYIGAYFMAIDEGIAHGVNPELKYICRRDSDGVGHIKIINDGEGSYWMPILEIMGKGMKNLLKR